MGTSAIQDDPLLRLRYYKETGQAREAATYEAYLRSTGQLPSAEQIATATAPDQPEPTPEPSYATKVLGGLASFLKDVPFGEAAQAGARSLVRGQSYADALKDIQNAESATPSAVRNINRVTGGVIAAAAIPGSPAIQAARYGILSGLGDSAPGQTVEDRVHSAALQGTVDALFGKVGDRALTAGRSLLASNPATNLLAKQAARAQSASRMYGAALAEGQGKAATPAIQAFLAEPDIAEIVGELKQTRPFASVAPDSPEMLDAVYKTLSDRSATIKKGLESVTPTRPNIGRYRGADVKAAQQEALGAMSGTPTTPGPMPSYRAAVEDFAKRSKEMDAIRKGYEALIKKAANAAPSAKQLTRSTPQAFSEWANQVANPMELQGAQQGLLGGVRQELGADNLFSLHHRGRAALAAAPSLLRMIDPTANRFGTAGLLGLMNPIASP